MAVQDETAYRDATNRRYERKRRATALSDFKELLTKPLYTVANDRVLMHNHLENNFFLGNKKAMFHNLKQYYELR